MRNVERAASHRANREPPGGPESLHAGRTCSTAARRQGQKPASRRESRPEASRAGDLAVDSEEAVEHRIPSVMQLGIGATLRADRGEVALQERCRLGGEGSGVTPGKTATSPRQADILRNAADIGGKNRGAGGECLDRRETERFQ